MLLILNDEPAYYFVSRLLNFATHSLVQFWAHYYFFLLPSELLLGMLVLCTLISTFEKIRFSDVQIFSCFFFAKKQY